MKLLHGKQKPTGFTLIEALLVIIILFVIAAMMLPATPHKTKATRILCIDNLKQIGEASRLWAEDNGGRFPLQSHVTTNDTSALLSDGIPSAQLTLWNFKCLTNLLTTTRVFHCPADEHTAWDMSYNPGFGNTNISYFVSPDADTSLTNVILSGDDNLAINDTPVNPGILEIPTNLPVAWTNERHRKAGNLVLADGSVQEVTTSGLQQALQQTGLATNRLAIP